MYLVGFVSFMFVMVCWLVLNVEFVELLLENEYFLFKLVERYKEFCRDFNGYLNGNLICNYGDSNQIKVIMEVKNVNISIVFVMLNRKFKERRKWRIFLEDFLVDFYMELLNFFLLQLFEGGGGVVIFGVDDYQY